MEERKPLLRVFQKEGKSVESIENSGCEQVWKKVWKVWITSCRNYAVSNYVNLV